MVTTISGCYMAGQDVVVVNWARSHTNPIVGGSLLLHTGKTSTVEGVKYLFLRSMKMIWSGTIGAELLPPSWDPHCPERLPGEWWGASYCQRHTGSLFIACTWLLLVSYRYSRIIVPCIARQPSCWRRWFIIGIALFIVREGEKGRSRTDWCKLTLIPNNENACSSNPCCRTGARTRPPKCDPCLATCTHWPAVLGVQGDWWGVLSSVTVAKPTHHMCRNQKVQVMKTLYMKICGKAMSFQNDVT